MSESLDRAEADRQTSPDNFDPHNPDTLPAGAWAYVGSNVSSAEERVAAYRAWREEQERELRMAAFAAQLSSSKNARSSQPAMPAAAETATVASPADDDELLTLKQAVAVRKVGAAQIKRAIKSGELEGECPERDGGRGYRVPRGKLMSWHPTSGRRKPIPPAAPKRELAEEQPPELRALGLRFDKSGV